MLDYNSLYEILRKERNSEILQPLPKTFLSDFSEYLKEQNNHLSVQTNLFSDQLIKTKKQVENSHSLLKEIIRIRKKKLLNLSLIATETGIMKRDFENMLPVEREMFESLIKTFERGDKEMSKLLSSDEQKNDQNKMIIFKKEVEQFIDHAGKAVGPFKTGELANLNSDVAQILVGEEKAVLVDEN